MGAVPNNNHSPSSQHQSILQEVLDSSSPSDHLIHSYGKSFNGFAANLTYTERQKLDGMKGIVSIFPSRTYLLQTTRSWDFIGLSENVKRIPKVESDVVVGLIDSGIWPESKSFSDEGFGPPPKKWKGVCKGGANFTCNNKLIGARFYTILRPGESPSVRDTQGHGTHTSSTAAGNEVKNVSFYGLREGNARGGVPSSRIAMYKVCWPELGCRSEDILAAFDDAINDGVDILSVSLGGSLAISFDEDPIAIGAFHAMQKGVLTLQSAGNDGPELSTVASVAPWIISVAASTIDSRIISKVILGDGTTLVGTAINGFDLKEKKFPLVYGGDHVGLKSCEASLAGTCTLGCLNSTLVMGKIVYCDFYASEAPTEVLNNKAMGGIFVERKPLLDYASVFPLPASGLNQSNGDRVKAYIKSTKNPVATILKSESMNDSTVPVVISFSSRGPNRITPDILKPDLTAPGVEILAAFSPKASPSNDVGDNRFVNYTIISGTSMSCPHVIAAAAYVKTFHPDWSPSAIRSALMTTAFALNASTNSDGELGYGAGHIDPVKAVNPGLVYEAFEGDYIKFLCNIGYSAHQIIFIGGNSTGCEKFSKGFAKDLNYPTMASQIQRLISIEQLQMLVLQIPPTQHLLPLLRI